MSHARPPPPPPLIPSPNVSSTASSSSPSLATALAKKDLKLKHTSTRIRNEDGTTRVVDNIIEDDALKLCIDVDVDAEPKAKSFPRIPVLPMQFIEFSQEMGFPLASGDKKLSLYRLVESQWAPFPSTSRQGCSTSAQPLDGSDFTLLTFNVWFSEWMWKERADALFSLIITTNADVVALQEVTPRFLGYMLYDSVHSHILRERYGFSDIVAPGRNAWTIGRYGVMLLVRPQISGLAMLKLPSNMGRWAVSVHIKGESCQCDLIVATVHLESLGNPHYRKAQLQSIAARVEDESCSVDCILCGDFNIDGSSKRYWEKRNGFGSESVENNVLKEVSPKAIECWELLHAADEGITFDMGNEKARYDRVVLWNSAHSPNWRPSSIEIVGKEPIPGLQGRGRAVTISDHYGLLAKFHRSDRS